MKYILNKSVGGIPLEICKEELLKLKGKPINKEYSQEDNTDRFFYKDFSVFIYYVNSIQSSTSIFPELVELESQSLAVGFTKERDLMEIMSKFHSQHQIEFICEADKEIDIDRMIFFPNVGITVWVEQGLINDICIQLVGAGD